MTNWPVLLEHLSLSCKVRFPAIPGAFLWQLMCLQRSRVFVVQQIIHVLSGQPHLANAPLLFSAGCSRPPSCQCKVDCKYWQGRQWGRDTVTLSGREGKSWRWRGETMMMMEARRERDGGGKRGELLPSLKATKCALMHCGREHTVSPERKSSITHRVHTVSTAELFKMPKRTCALSQDGAYWDVNLILRQLKCIMLISRITED